MGPTGEHNATVGVRVRVLGLEIRLWLGLGLGIGLGLPYQQGVDCNTTNVMSIMRVALRRRSSFV